MGESSIISNILSLDCDTWDESLTSPQNLAKFLGETDKHQGSHRMSSPWRVQQSNQSRFSFAREEEPATHVPEAESSLGFRDQAFKPQYYGHDFANKANFHGDRFGARNGFSLLNGEEPDTYSSNHSLFNSSKLMGARSQIAAPPGFSTPNRAPPPGFMSHERVEQTFNSFSGQPQTAHLFNAPVGEDEAAIGVGTVGSLEAIMLAGLAFKRKWQDKRKAKGKPDHCKQETNEPLCLAQNVREIRIRNYTGAEAEFEAMRYLCSTEQY